MSLEDRRQVVSELVVGLETCGLDLGFGHFHGLPKTLDLGADIRLG
jgi:hypothetical protein